MAGAAHSTSSVGAAGAAAAAATSPCGQPARRSRNIERSGLGLVRRFMLKTDRLSAQPWCHDRCICRALYGARQRLQAPTVSQVSPVLCVRQVACTESAKCYVRVELPYLLLLSGGRSAIDASHRTASLAVHVQASHPFDHSADICRKEDCYNELDNELIRRPCFISILGNTIHSWQHK